MPESLQTAAETLLSQLPQPAAKPIPDYSRLDYDEIALLLRLRDAGKTQTEIAQVLGCSQPTVSTVLKEFTDTRELAKLTLNSNAKRLTDRVIEQADVDQSLELLDRIGVAEKRHGEKTTAVQVNVGIAV